VAAACLGIAALHLFFSVCVTAPTHPHLPPTHPTQYGLIDFSAVARELAVQRDATTGAFLAIEGLQGS
jgi:hypothetical protein